MGKKLLGIPSGTEIAANMTKHGNTSTTNNDHQRKQQPDYAQTVARSKDADKAQRKRIKLAKCSRKAGTGWERMCEKKKIVCEYKQVRIWP
jgi:hypothetical protein